MKLYTYLLAILLASCGWDMTTEAWSHAQELCSTFGGVYAVDYNNTVTGRIAVRARCVNNQYVSANFARQP